MIFYILLGTESQSPADVELHAEPPRHQPAYGGHSAPSYGGHAPY